METNILHQVVGNVGQIILNRPKKLNALDRASVRELREILEKFAKDSEVCFVILRSNIEKAFCAGGDLLSDKKILEEEGLEAMVDELRAEYALASQITHFDKPILVYLNGITMGGGAGISVGADIRIVTETTQWAMPEMRIGLFPDVALSYYFARMQAGLGEYLAITSNSIQAEDCLWAGVADYKIQSGDYTSLEKELLAMDWYGIEKEEILKKIQKKVEQYSSPKCIGNLEKRSKELKQYFTKSSFKEVFQSLEQEKETSDFARSILDSLNKNSILSMAITWELLKRAKKLSLEECYQLDLVLIRSYFQGKDIFEGIRAILIEKTKDPKWEYKNIDEIPTEVVLSYFK